MTIYVNETAPTVDIAINQANLVTTPAFYFFDVISEWSHQVVASLQVNVMWSNDRYSMIQVQFPAGFGDSHQNGVYYYTLRSETAPIEEGLVKIITNPGGEINSLAYDSGVITEDRVSDVYFRPNY